MVKQGYKLATSMTDATVIAYGFKDKYNVYHVTHFSKKTSTGGSIAKWGKLEVMNSKSTTPYKSTSSYGAGYLAIYKK